MNDALQQVGEAAGIGSVGFAVAKAEVGPRASSAPEGNCWSNYRPGAVPPNIGSPPQVRGAKGYGREVGKPSDPLVRCVLSILKHGGGGQDRHFKTQLDSEGWASCQAIALETKRSVVEIRDFLGSASCFEVVAVAARDAAAAVAR